MTPETLESLLADRALGELAPETQELLDAYLTEHPDAAARAEALTRATTLARAALKVTATLPTVRARPAALPWEKAARPRLAFRRAEWLRLAACLAVGLAAGWLVKPARRPPVAGAPATVATLTPDQVGERATPAGAAGFWSTNRFTRSSRSGTSGDRRSALYRIDWISPAKMPRLEEKP